VRAPSSAKPAANIPRVDCPEKIVSSFGALGEVHHPTFSIQIGNTETKPNPNPKP